MASQTFDAVSKVLGVLGTAIKDEAALQGSLQGNMQFIKDELDSMNGFLLHLTKTESEHDDQIRAWMKQVRDAAYIAEDCVVRYTRDVVPHELWSDCGVPYVAELAFLLRHCNKYRLRHRLAKQIEELKARVNDVSERRKRYGVNVPAATLKEAEDARQEESRSREDFRRGLLRLKKQGDSSSTPSPQPADDAPDVVVTPSCIDNDVTSSSSKLPAQGDDVPTYIRLAIKLLPSHVQPHGDTVVCAWKKCRPSPGGEDDPSIIDMLLCALYACPYKLDNNLEFGRLETKLKEGARPEEIKRQAMVFCYSLLSAPQKSCLQYLTAFLEETAISRTSLVRRWVAEGLVGREQGRTPEEVGERYFNELDFRGFIHRARLGDAGTVKSCKPLTGTIRDFITDITASENFVAQLPVHLDWQLKIRKMVRRPRPHQQQHHHQACCWTRRRDASAAGREREPMDELVDFLKKLPEMYRLNVLDLGGCSGLEKRHITAICSVASLKYLCLRKTDIPCLDPKLLKRLTVLETLDIRQTNIPAADVKAMYLEKLKHLLAGRYLTEIGADAGTARASAEVLRLATVDMPDKIGNMTNMETLSHVQVSSNDGKELARVARLEKLRKLGVVIHGNDRTAAQLRDVVYALSGCLRSLSVWVTKEGGALDISILKETTSDLILENLDINGRCSLPSWIEGATKLANVSLRDTELSGGEILRRLGHVRTLRCLRLGRRSFIGQVLSFKDVQFEALRFLIVYGDTATRVTFEADAAPKLEKIVCHIGSRVHTGDLIVGIQHLGHLEVIELTGNFNLPKLVELKQGATTAAATNASDNKTGYYHCRYLDSSGEKLFVEVPKTATTDTTFSLPVGVLNQQNVV